MAVSTLVSARAIQDFYERTGNTCGWRLLSSPVETLEGAELAFVGLNPGGSKEEEDQAQFAMDHGSAYVREKWGSAPHGQSPLQRQVRQLFQRLGVLPEKVLSGNLVPFRSPSWDALIDKKRSVAFGVELWREILARAKPRLIIGMGGEVANQLAKLLAARNEERIELGWSAVTGSRWTFENGTLVRLPHLSRFGVVGRPQSEAALAKLFQADWQ